MRTYALNPQPGNSLRNSICRLINRLLPILVVCFMAGRVEAQITNTVFFEDFESGVIDPERFAPDAPFFEGGVGDISAGIVNGQLEFTGTVSQQWWAGATLRVVPTFSVSEEADIIASVDRVQEAGVGTASRSAFWIMDETQTKYVLFADVRNEGGWRYNRKIDEPGDSPTGSGVAIPAFVPFDTPAGGGLRQMKLVANGQTVRLYLDGIFGAEVRFPFSTLVFHVGSYARANGDTARTIFDNFRVETVGKISFGVNSVTLQQGQTGDPVVVRIPPGVNATSDVQIRVVSSNPAIAVPAGATGGTLNLNFPAGGANEQTIEIETTGASGGAQFTLANDIGMSAGNVLHVTVIEPAGTRFEENFAASTLDPAKWELNPQGFEGGTGRFFTDLSTQPGALEIWGEVDTSFWPGLSVRTVPSFTATQELPLIVQVDRLSIDPSISTAARTGIYLTTSDRSQFIFFGQNYGETGWQVNVNPGSPTGSGVALSAFNALAQDTGPHRLKIIADGDVAEVFLNDVSGGLFSLPVSSGLHVELGSYARAAGDYVSGFFDNVKVENAIPCIGAAPRAITAAQGSNTNLVTVTIPRLLNADQEVQVTVTSNDPDIAAPQGAINGSLTLTFAAGADNSQSFAVITGGTGRTTFAFSNNAGACMNASVEVTVTTPLGVVFSDDFAQTIDPARWQLSTVTLNPATPGTATEASAVTIENGAVQMAVTAETSEWPGFELTTVESYSAELFSPVAFEIDRVDLGFRLVTGTSAKQRTGVWVRDASGANYVFFGEFATWDGAAGGWRYNRSIGEAGDTALPAAGVAIPAFNAARFNDQGNHRLRIVVNGETARLYLDGVFGAEVAFPFANNLVFGFGTYVLAATDEVTGIFDNAAVLTAVETLGTLTASREANGNVVISWQGTGTLQSNSTIHNPAGWSSVTPAPTGNSITIPAAELNQQRFYRLAQ
jgi:hypothetical protein